YPYVDGLDAIRSDPLGRTDPYLGYQELSRDKVWRAGANDYQRGASADPRGCAKLWFDRKNPFRRRWPATLVSMGRRFGAWCRRRNSWLDPDARVESDES